MNTVQPDPDCPDCDGTCEAFSYWLNRPGLCHCARRPLYRPVFVASSDMDPDAGWRAKKILREHGFLVRRDDNMLLLIDADDEDATRAGNLLVDHGFRGGVCW